MSLHNDSSAEYGFLYSHEDDIYALTETNPNKRDKNCYLFDMNRRDRKSGCEV